MQDHNELFSALINLRDFNELKEIKRLFIQYLLAVEAQGLEVTPLRQVFLSLCSMRVKDDETINFRQDVIIPIGKFQLSCEQQMMDHSAKAKELISQLTTKERYAISDRIQQYYSLPDPHPSPTVSEIYRLIDNKNTSMVFIPLITNALNATFQIYFFDILAKDIMRIISNHLECRDIKNLALACHQSYNYRLFKSLLNEPMFLNSVLNADPQRAEKILLQCRMQSKNWWKCILAKTSGKEPCGRVWNKVSALEYLTFIGDTYFRKRLLAFIPAEGADQACQQIKNVKLFGLEGQEQHAPLYAFIDICDNPFFLKSSGSGRFLTMSDFFKEIGRLQYQLSCFGWQWLCDNKPFEPDSPSWDWEPSRELTVNGKPFSIAHSLLRESYHIYKREDGNWSVEPPRVYLGPSSIYLHFQIVKNMFEMVINKDSAALIIEIESLEQLNSLSNLEFKT